MNTILKKSNKLIKEMQKHEKETGEVPASWEGIATVAMGAIKDPTTFEEAVEPLMKWLGENQHPHTAVIVRNDYAELFEGLQVHLTKEFIVD